MYGTANNPDVKKPSPYMSLSAQNDAMKRFDAQKIKSPNNSVPAAYPSSYPVNMTAGLKVGQEPSSSSSTIPSSSDRSSIQQQNPNGFGTQQPQLGFPPVLPTNNKSVRAGEFLSLQTKRQEEAPKPNAGQQATGGSLSASEIKRQIEERAAEKKRIEEEKEQMRKAGISPYMSKDARDEVLKRKVSEVNMEGT